MAAAHPDVVAKMEALLSREHQPSSAFPIPAIDGETPRYVVARSAATTRALLDAAESAWAKAQRITWGPEAIATSFRALWTSAGLAVRYDVTDASPWHTLTQRDERLWNEEVVELFLDVGATGRSYAEIEWNPVNAVVDLWVDRAENRFDKDWNVAGLESRVHPRKDAAGRATGWTAVSLLPWTALSSKAPAGHGAAAEGGGSLAVQRLPHRAPRRAEGAPEGRAVPGVVAHGKPQLPRPPRLPGARLRRDAERLASRAATRVAGAAPAPEHRVDRDRRPGLLGDGRLRKPRRAYAGPGSSRARGRRLPQRLRDDARVLAEPRRVPHRPLRQRAGHHRLDLARRGRRRSRPAARHADVARDPARERLAHGSRRQVAPRPGTPLAPVGLRHRRLLRLPRRREHPDGPQAGGRGPRAGPEGLASGSRDRRGHPLPHRGPRPALCPAPPLPRAAHALRSGAGGRCRGPPGRRPGHPGRRAASTASR